MAPRKTKKKGRKGMLDAGSGSGVPVVGDAQNGQSEMNSPQRLQNSHDAMQGVEIAPVLQNRDEPPLPSIETASAPAPSPEDVDDLVTAPPVTSSAQPSQTSSVSLGLATKFTAREKSVETQVLREEVEGKMKAYKSPFGPPAPVATRQPSISRQPSIPRQSSLSRQPAPLTSISQPPANMSRDTHTPLPSMIPASTHSAHSQSHNPSHNLPSISPYAQQFSQLHVSMNSPFDTTGAQFPHGSPYGFPEPPPFLPSTPGGFQPVPSSRLSMKGPGTFASPPVTLNGYENAAPTTGFTPTNGNRSQYSAPPPSSMSSQSENRFMPAASTSNGRNASRASSSVPLQGRASQDRDISFEPFSRREGSAGVHHAPNGGFIMRASPLPFISVATRLPVNAEMLTRPMTSSRGFTPVVTESNGGEANSFMADLASAVDNTIRQISAEVQPVSRAHSLQPTRTPEASLQTQHAGGVMSRSTGISSVVAEEMHALPKPVMQPVTVVKRGRGRPKKNPALTPGKGKFTATVEAQSNSVLPSIENGEFAKSFENQQQSSGFMPANGQPQAVMAPPQSLAPARVSESAQPTVSFLPTNGVSSTSEQASPGTQPDEGISSAIETPAMQTQSDDVPRTKRKYTKRTKGDSVVLPAPLRLTRATPAQTTPADGEHGIAEPGMLTQATRVSATLPVDSDAIATGATALTRATRAAKRNAPSDSAGDNAVEPPVKKRKYTRKQVPTAPIEEEVNAPELQPVPKAGGIEEVVTNPVLIQEQPSVTSEAILSQSSKIVPAVEARNQLVDPVVVPEEPIRNEEIPPAIPPQPDVQTAEPLAVPDILPFENLEQMLDQGQAVEEQVGGRTSNGITPEGNMILDNEDIPIVDDIGEIVSDIPAALEDDSEPVAEPHPKQKRNPKSVEVDPEEPLAKRPTLTGDQYTPAPTPTKRAYNTKKKAAIAEAAAQAAADEQAFSISCTFKGEDGHLVLTAKRTLLQFFATSQHPPQFEPRYSLLIADLTKRPITSARKSNPMCLRLKGKTDPRGSDFAFAVPQSQEGYDAMHEMRSRIVAASLESEFQPNPEVGINARLYQCEKCGLTFKNPNGKEYHLEKSQSACNPNHDPSKIAARKKGGRQKGVASKAKKADLDFASEDEDGEFELDLGLDVTPDIEQELEDLADSSVARPTKAPRAAKLKTPRKRHVRDTSPESEDSIYAWAEATANSKTATGGNVRTASLEPSNAEPRQMHKASADVRNTRPEPKKSARRYKNLQGEAPFLAAVEKELADQEQGSADAIPPLLGTQLTTEVCEKLFVDLVLENNGLFPGDKSMWFAFVARWWKDFKLSKIMPESKKCSYVLDDLVETGRLRKLEFIFRDKKSRDITRAIYVSPDYDENNESFTLMKESIKSAHPIFHVPENFGPPQHLIEPLEKLVTRPPVTRKPKVTEPELGAETSQEPDGMYDPFDEDEYSVEASGSLDDEDFLDMDLMDSIEDDVYQNDGSAAAKNAKIAASIRKWHEKRKALGLKQKPPTPRNQPNRGAGPPIKRGLTREEKERRYLEEASSPCWGAPAPAFLPNPVTGAWDTKPVKAKGISTAISAKPRGVRYGIAEPITYLQSENGAWSHRAYGHGVKPIYSRPSKLVANNPAQAAYLARIQSGFRPIVYPTKNMIYGPAPLTKSRAIQVQKPKGKRSGNKPSPISQEINPDDEDSGSDFEATRRHNLYKDLVPDSASNPKRRVAPKATKPPAPAPGMNEIDVLNYIEPKKLPIGSTQNPGLATLPPMFSEPTMRISPSEHIWGTGYQVSFSFSQTIVADSNFKDGSWVSNKKGPRQRTYDKIRFDEETAFDLETLPYNQLDDVSEEEEEEEQPPLKRLRFSVPKSDDLQPDQVQGKVKGTRNKKLHPTRPQTALAVDFDGLTEDPAALAKYLGVQMLPIKEGDQVRKRLRIGNRMTRSEEKRFVVTVIVVRVIAGGIDQYIDWVLVANLFPEFSMNYLSKNWAAIAKKKQDLIDELVVDFQEAFLVGYRDGKIKPINFNDLLSYDWARLVRWTMKHVNTSLTRTAIQLPADREDLNEDYIATEAHNENGEAQKMYFGLICPIYRRLDAVAARQMTTPLKPIEAPGDNNISDFLKAKSFARSSALTPIETWDFHAAKEKLTQLSDDLLEAAIDALKEDKVIIKRNKARSTTGRIYEASDAFAAPLRKPIKSEVYQQAYHYKEFLDASFRSGTESLRVDYFGDEGSYMCVTSLMASGRLRVTGLNIPIAPMGLGDDAHPYDTKRIPKAKMRWDIEMSPSPTYLYNEDNETLQNITEMEAPSSRSGAVPAWNGIHDMVIPNLWKRVLCAIISTVALRTGLSKKMLRLTFKPTLEEWEIGLFMRWAEEVGLVERLDEDESVDGWMAGEWFWLCLGRMVEYLEEMEETQRREYEERTKEAEMGKGKGRAVQEVFN